MLAITGPRRLTPAQEKRARQTMVQLSDTHWHVGDAPGIDALATAEAISTFLTPVRVATS